MPYPEMTCPHCQYKWIPRTPNPKKCPNYNCGNALPGGYPPPLPRKAKPLT